MARQGKTPPESAVLCTSRLSRPGLSPTRCDAHIGHGPGWRSNRRLPDARDVHLRLSYTPRDRRRFESRSGYGAATFSRPANGIAVSFALVTNSGLPAGLLHRNTAVPAASNVCTTVFTIVSLELASICANDVSLSTPAAVVHEISVFPALASTPLAMNR